jgi:transposase
MRKRFSAKFKAQVALEAIKNESTIAELAKKHEVNPTQIQRWKADLLSNAEQVFSQESKGKAEVDEKYVEALERKAGQLAIEVDFLKKNLVNYHGKNGSK